MAQTDREKKLVSVVTGVALLIFGLSIGVTLYWVLMPGRDSIPEWIQASAAVFSAGAVALVALTLRQEERRERREVSTMAWVDLYRLLEMHGQYLGRVTVLDTHLARAAGCDPFGPAAFSCLRSYLDHYVPEKPGQAREFWRRYAPALTVYMDLFVSICDQRDLIKSAVDTTEAKPADERIVVARAQNLAKAATTVDERSVLQTYIIHLSTHEPVIMKERGGDFERVAALLDLDIKPAAPTAAATSVHAP